VSRTIPARYDVHPAEQFGKRVSGALDAGIQILDVGSGRRPAIASEDRPPGVRYAGLDISAAELAAAPAGSYTDHVVADIAVSVPDLDAQFDLIVSWQVLEHVRDTERALANLRAYLRPRGRLLALLSCRLSINGLLNAAIPPRVGSWLMRRLLGRDPESVFPAYYDRCTATELDHLLAAWTMADVTPLYVGASYFNFSMALRDAYLAYESWAYRGGRADLATHYLIDARR